MYILWEYVLCVFVAAALISILLAAGALGYLLKTFCIMLVGTLRTATARAAAGGAESAQHQAHPRTLRSRWSSLIRVRAL